MKVIVALLLGMVAAAILMVSLLIQLLMQLLPLLVLAAVVVGVVRVARQWPRRPSTPPGYMLVPIPGHPASTAPQRALPAPRRNPADVLVFGPVHPGDDASHWEWR